MPELIAAELVAKKAQQLTRDLSMTAVNTPMAMSMSAAAAAVTQTQAFAHTQTHAQTQLEDAAAVKAARTKEIQDQIAAQIAAVSQSVSRAGVG